jgi:6-phosphogluconolactonase (cycloisomerase 2 family)
MKLRLTVFACSLVLVGLAAGSAAAATLYVPIYGGLTDKVVAANTASDGGLTALAGSPFAIGDSNGLSGVAFTPDGNRGAASFSFDGGFQGLKVDAAGGLSGAQAVSGTVKSHEIAVSPDGRFAFIAANSAPNTGVYAYTIDAAGALTVVPGSPFWPANGFDRIVVAPNGKFLWAAQSGAIRPFAIQANGALTPLPAHASTDTDTLNVSSNGAFLFITSFTADTVRAARIFDDGSLGSVGTPIQVGSASPGRIALSRDASRIYVGDYNGWALGGQYSVNTYAVSADGVISPVGSTPTGDFRIRRVAVSPDGRFLYAEGSGLGEILVATIGANGLPGPFRVTGQTAATPTALDMLFRPVQPSTAAFSYKTGSASRTLYFDGVASAFPGGATRQYSWSFGDGGAVTDGSPTTSHKFAKAGVYDVTLTAIGDGCGAEFVYGGRSTVCAGGAGARKTISVDTPPWIESLKLSPTTLKKSSKIKFKLTEKATVTFWVEKPASGRLVGTSCKKQTTKNKKFKKCTRWLHASKSFKKSAKSGSNTIKFTGKVGSKTVANGSYRLAATAVDKAKGKSPLATAKFRIKIKR